MPFRVSSKIHLKEAKTVLENERQTSQKRMKMSKKKGTNGTTIISPPRRGLCDHERGYPMSVTYLAVDEFERRLEKKSRESNRCQTRKKERGGRSNPGPSPDAKQVVTV